MVKGQGERRASKLKQLPVRSPGGALSLLSIGKDDDPLTARTNILRGRANLVHAPVDLCRKGRPLLALTLALSVLATGCWTDIAFDPTTEVAEADVELGGEEPNMPIAPAPQDDESLLAPRELEPIATPTVESNDPLTVEVNDNADVSVGPAGADAEDDDYGAESFAAELAAVSPEATAEVAAVDSTETNNNDDAGFPPLPWEVNEEASAKANADLPQDSTAVALPEKVPPADIPLVQLDVEDEPQLEEDDSLDWLTGTSDVPVDGASETSDTPNPTTVDSSPPLQEPADETLPLPWETPDAVDTATPDTDTTEPDSTDPEATLGKEVSVETLPLPSDLGAGDALFEASDEAASGSDSTFSDAVEIDTNNTQLLAWEVATVLSSALIDPDRNALDAADTVLTYAKQLGIDLSLLPLDQIAPQQASPKQLLAVGRKLGEQVAKQHDRQHAALAEVAFKSQLLVALLPARPQLKPTIVDSVAGAAARANIPAEIVQAWQVDVNSSSDASVIVALVEQFHTSISQHLQSQQPAIPTDSSSLLR